MDETVYKDAALIPPSPWIDNIAPIAPDVSIKKNKDSLQITWTHTNESDVFRYVIYYRHGTVWNYTICNRNDRMLDIKLVGGTDKSPTVLNKIAVTAVDRTGNESERKEMDVN